MNEQQRSKPLSVFRARLVVLGAEDARMIASLLNGPGREATPSMRKAMTNYSRREIGSEWLKQHAE